jgi:hypothetical protein
VFANKALGKPCARHGLKRRQHNAPVASARSGYRLLIDTARPGIAFINEPIPGSAIVFWNIHDIY